MQLATARGNPFQNPFLPSSFLFVTLLSAPGGTVTTVLTPLPCDEHVRVYQSALGEFQSTANTTLAFTERLTRTDAGFPAVSPIKTAAVAGPDSFQVRSALHQLRRLSGLTWENLADVLGVTRRSLHLWANGGPINSHNEKQVRDLLATMHALDRGTATENRRLLLTSVDSGKTFADLLRTREFAKAVFLAGRGTGRPALPKTDEGNVKSGISRVSIADMLGTNPERIHADDGKFLPSRRRTTRV
jgi:hypothetical protein